MRNELGCRIDLSVCCRRAFTSGSAGMKRYSAALQAKFHVDSLMEQLRRTRVTFIHCFLPQVYTIS
jgi:hypothetical protein